MKKPILRFGTIMGVLLMTTMLVFNSCKKDNNGFPNPANNEWDNSAMTKASFIGQVLKEDGTPLDGAKVSTGTHQITTDADGFFYFTDISTPQKATSIKVEKAGYFNAFRTVPVIANEDNQVMFMIMELPTPQNLDAAAGGTIVISNGGSIDFPANAIIDATTNLPYTGNVSVFAKWIDPTSDDIGLLAPGDLRAINAENEERVLGTYGMQAVELVGSAGQKLQLGNGQSAQVKFPLPNALTASAPATIPLWHFDEAQGMWVEEGTATKVGGEYVGEVSHFSFWNCDIPFLNVNCQVTLVDANNNPVVGAYVKLTTTSTAVTVGSAGGFTNSSGTVSGVIPQSANFTLEYIPAGCSWTSPAIFIQNFSSGTTNVNLGTIQVANASNPAVVTGTAEDCNNVLLANAPVKIKVGTYLVSTFTNASGAFTGTVNCLSGATAGDVYAYDVANNVYGSNSVTLTPNTTTNAGAVLACGTQFDFITIDVTNPPATTPTTYTIVEPTGTFNQYYQLETAIYGSDNSSPANQGYISFSFDGPQTVAGTHNLTRYYDMNDSVSSFTPAIVNLTNYGAVGQKISGNFTTTANGLIYNGATINCNFRVTRQQ